MTGEPLSTSKSRLPRRGNLSNRAGAKSGELRCFPIIQPSRASIARMFLAFAMMHLDQTGEPLLIGHRPVRAAKSPLLTAHGRLFVPASGLFRNLLTPPRPGVEPAERHRYALRPASRLCDDSSQLTLLRVQNDNALSPKRSDHNMLKMFGLSALPCTFRPMRFVRIDAVRRRSCLRFRCEPIAAGCDGMAAALKRLETE